MSAKPTISCLAKLLEKWFVKDESLPKRKREQAQMIVEELRGILSDGQEIRLYR